MADALDSLQDGRAKAVRSGDLYGGTPRHSLLDTPAFPEWGDSLLPTSHLERHRIDTAEKSTEFVLGFTGPDTAPFRPRDQNHASTLGDIPLLTILRILPRTLLS